MRDLEFIRRSPAVSGDPADPWVPDYQVSESAVGTLPSTRAGGQDDGSLNKLPQTKLVNDKWY